MQVKGATRTVYRLSIFLLCCWSIVIGYSPDTKAAQVVVVPLIGTSKSGIPASDVVELTAWMEGGTSSYLFNILPDGSSSGSFTVPSGKLFVATSLEIAPASLTTGTGTLYIKQGGYNRRIYNFPLSEISRFTYSPGMMFDANAHPLCENTGSTTAVTVYMQGYLIDN